MFAPLPYSLHAGLGRSKLHPGSVPGTEYSTTRQVPRAPLPDQGVTSPGVMSSTTSEGFHPPSSLILTHAPDQIPRPDFVSVSFSSSLQVVASPCWEMVLPDFISAILTWALGPLPRRVLLMPKPVSSQKASASPTCRQVQHAKLSLQATSRRGWISGLQSFLYVQAPMFARPPGCSHPTSQIERQGRLHHAADHPVTSMNCGIATYPKPGN